MLSFLHAAFWPSGDLAFRQVLLFGPKFVGFFLLMLSPPPTRRRIAGRCVTDRLYIGVYGVYTIYLGWPN